MKKLLFSLLLLLSISPCSAQNVTCTTRPPGDTTNACASTAFVQNAVGGGGSGMTIGVTQVIGATNGDLFYNNNGLLGDSGGGLPSIPVIHPSSGNLVGAGCGTAHQAWWVDQNICGTGDTWILHSSDPSALATVTVTGTTGTGTIVLTYTFGSGACVAGCSTTVNTTSGQSTTTVAANIITALQANASLYNNVAGAQGQLLYLISTTNVISYDYDVRNSTQVKYTCTSCGLTLTFGAGQSTVNTNYALPTTFDVNPVLGFARIVPGVAPPIGSVIFGLIAAGAQSTSPSLATVQYGAAGVEVRNSTTGALSSRWYFVTPNVSNVLNQGMYIGAGVYTVGVADKGIDTIATKDLWANTLNGLTTPIPVTEGGTGLAAGTSGGIPCFASTTTMASSSLLTAGSLLVGGGAGVCPSTIAGSSATLTNLPILTLTSVNSSGPQFNFENDVNDTTAGLFIAKKSRAGANVASGDFIFNFIGEPFANSIFQNAFQMNFKVSGSPSTNNVPTKLEYLLSNSSGLLNTTYSIDGASSHITLVAAAPPTTGTCGTSPAITAGSTDQGGEITVGTAAPTSCVVNFGVAWTVAPKCVVTSQTQLAAFAYVIATGTITVTQTGTSSNKINWVCGPAGV